MRPAVSSVARRAARAATRLQWTRGLASVPGIPQADRSTSSFGRIEPKVPSVTASDPSKGESAPDAAGLLLHKYVKLGGRAMASPDFELDLQDLANDARRFVAEFGADPTAPDAFTALSKHYYALPRPEMIIPAFVALLGSEEGLAGKHQLSQALFFGRALAGLEDAALPLGVLMLRIVEATGDVLVQGLSTEEEQQRAARLLAARKEGALLVLRHTENEALQSVVEQAVAAARNALSSIAATPVSGEAEEADNKGEGDEQAAGSGETKPRGLTSAAEKQALLSIAAEQVARMELLLPSETSSRGPVRPYTWPLPGLPYEEPTFFNALSRDSPIPWTMSSDLISLALTARSLGGNDGEGLSSEVWARLGLAVGEAMQDALWAEFYATGSVMAARKCMAAAAEWLPFMDEHGPEHVLDSENTPIPARYTWPEEDKDEDGESASKRDAADEDLADGRERMRFHLARRAVSRLVREASVHPLLVEIVELERRDLMHLANLAVDARQKSPGRPTVGRMLTVSASARQAAASIEALRPLFHMALAEGRAFVSEYAAVWAQRLPALHTPDKPSSSSSSESSAAMPSNEPSEASSLLCGDEAGVLAPGGLVAMGWALPPMVATVWQGESSLPIDMRGAQDPVSDGAVLQAVGRSGQVGKTGFCLPLASHIPQGATAMPNVAEEEPDVTRAVQDATTSGSSSSSNSSNSSSGAEGEATTTTTETSTRPHVDWAMTAKRAGFGSVTADVAHEAFLFTRRVREEEAEGKSSDRFRV